ncbi:MAG: hypothetical protein J6Y40_02805 [Bacteroidales bacterium]|nr:hypothetical protein [Bacteroidales bacterium]
MNLLFNKEEEYTSPVCRVYSVNLEGAIATISSSSEVPGVVSDDDDNDGEG